MIRSRFDPNILNRVKADSCTGPAPTRTRKHSPNPRANGLAIPAQISIDKLYGHSTCAYCSKTMPSPCQAHAKP